MSGEGKKATIDQILVSFIIGHQCAMMYDCVITELPILVQRLPEYWDLPVVLGLEFTLVCALMSGIFLALMKLTTVIDALNKHRPALLLTMAILKVILLVLMMAYWDSTSTIYGKKYSIAFQVIWVLMFCVKSVDFLFGISYVGTFPQKCVSAFYFGMGCGGTVYGVITFLQGAGEFDCVNKTQNATQLSKYLNGSDNLLNLKDLKNSLDLTDRQAVVFRPSLFTVETYFAIVMGISLCCCASLLGHVVFLRLRPTTHETETIQLINRDDADASYVEEVTKQTAAVSNSEEEPANNWTVYAITVTVYSCLDRGLSYGASQPLMAYATLPYGTLTFALSRRLSSAVEPLGSLVCAFFPIQSLRALSLMLGTCLMLCLYVSVVAVMTPSPPFALTHPEIGSGLVVSSYILLSLVRCYLRAALTTLAAGLGQKLLTYYSLILEFSLVVLIVPSFVCLDVLKLLTDIPQCS